MKKIGFLLTMFIMMTLFVFSASALEPTGQCGDNVYWSFDESTGELVISGYGEIWEQAFRNNDDIKKVVIEEGITHTGDIAFSGCDSLESVTFPESLLVVGDYSFGLCKNLTNVTLPSNLSKIDDFAFVYCYGLTEIFIPESVSYIGYDAFYACYYLRNITVSEHNIMYTSDENGVLFDKNKTVLIQCPTSASITKYIIPNSVKVISDSAFNNQQYLTEIVIPHGVQFIDRGVFFSCQKLNTITIPCTVKTIKEDAFSSCYNLKDVYYMDNETNWAKVNILKDDQYDSSKLYLERSTIHFHNHDYENEFETLPSCTDQGFTTHTCDCGDFYVDDYTDATGHSHTAQITTPATHLTEGVKTYTCDCGDTYTETIAKISEHTYFVLNVILPTCENSGYTIYTCECGDTYNGDKTSATGHNYEGDYCVTCGESKTDNCSCNCHKGGFNGFIWKLLRFFYKLFKINPVCSCGIAHY